MQLEKLKTPQETTSFPSHAKALMADWVHRVDQEKSYVVPS
jgi:hypothetical protein